MYNERELIGNPFVGRFVRTLYYLYQQEETSMKLGVNTVLFKGVDVKTAMKAIKAAG